MIKNLSANNFHPPLVKGGEGGFKEQPWENLPKSPFSKGGHYKQTLFTDRL
jgi:hypothetical protein